MEMKKFLCQAWVILLLALLPLGAARAEEPVHGFVEAGYLADRPAAGKATGAGDGYALTVAYALPDDFLVFAGYDHLSHPVLSPPAGDGHEDDYEAGAKFVYPVSESLRWVTALAYAEERDHNPGGPSTDRGYDVVQGLRIEATEHLELVTDLHHSRIGSSSNALTLGLVQGFTPRFALAGFYNHSRSKGLDDDSYVLALRIYY
jgi:hypothetical protein